MAEQYFYILGHKFNLKSVHLSSVMHFFLQFQSSRQSWNGFRQENSNE